MHVKFFQPAIYICVQRTHINETEKGETAKLLQMNMPALQYLIAGDLQSTMSYCKLK